MPDSMLEFKHSVWLALISLLVITGCSLHYDTGKELESEGRYEEASIEYHRAFVDDPDAVSYTHLTLPTTPYV